MLSHHLLQTQLLRPSTESSLIAPLNLDDARGPITGSTIDYTAACTATEHRACQIVRQLAVWNEFLLPARLELREDSSASPGPGRLSLVSYDKPSLRQPTHEELHLSATVVKAILKTHGCVTRVAVVHTWLLKPHGTLLGDALRYNCNSSLKYLTLGFESFSDRSVWSVLSSLVQLEELECLSSEECPDEFLGTLSTLLRNTKSLRALRISELRINRRGFGPMFMERPSRSGPAGEHGEYSRDLVVIDHDMKNYAVERFMQALKENSDCEGTGTQRVQRVLARHRSLRSFEVSVRHHYSSGRLHGISPRTEFDDWLVAITQNDVVEEVTFTFHMPFVFSDPDKWEAFAKELPTRTNLKKVTIAAFREDAFLSVLCRVLRQNGAEDKVSFLPYNVQENLDLLQCRAFSGVYACVFQIPDTQFQRLLEALPSFRHVTTVRLDVWMSCMEEALSYSIVECIESSTSIRELQLISSLHDQSTTDHWAGDNRVAIA
ncbi:hypothetical protein MTO96_033088 [Rhipicephalus appendiculatus]